MHLDPQYGQRYYFLNGAIMISLRIYDIKSGDIGKGVARLNPKDMKEIGVSPWDLVEIGGKRKTIVRVMPCDKSDTRKSTIRLDIITRENARVDLDEHVIIKKISSKSATKVVLAPRSNDLLYNSNENKYLVERLDGFPITAEQELKTFK